MGGARILRWRSSEENFCCTPLFQMWGVRINDEEEAGKYLEAKDIWQVCLLSDMDSQFTAA